MLKDNIKSFVFKIVGVYNKQFNKTKYFDKTISPIEEDYLDIKNKKILYLAPHVDDESIGMGGTINKIKKNNETFLVFTTNSGGSYTDLSKEELIKSRKAEAKKVVEYLDIDRLEFLDYEDGNLSNENKDLVKDIKKIIDDFKPDIIFSTSIIDYHNDHRETTRALVRALEDIDFKGEIYLYPINIQYRYGGVNSISLLSENDLSAKKHLYNIFASQKGMGFTIFEKLDVWRGQYINRDNQGAEWFIKFNKKELLEFEKELINSKIDFSKLYPVSNELSFAKSFKYGEYETKQFNILQNILNKDNNTKTVDN